MFVGVSGGVVCKGSSSNEKSIAPPFFDCVSCALSINDGASY